MACRRSLKNLNLDYVDLYLMHSPIGYEYREPEDLMPLDEKGNVVLTDDDYLETWRAMERLVDLGKKLMSLFLFKNSNFVLKKLQNYFLKFF
jgi:aldehyde reductase